MAGIYEVDTVIRESGERDTAQYLVAWKRTESDEPAVSALLTPRRDDGNGATVSSYRGYRRAVGEVE